LICVKGLTGETDMVSAPSEEVSVAASAALERIEDLTTEDHGSTHRYSGTLVVKLDTGHGELVLNFPFERQPNLHEAIGVAAHELGQLAADISEAASAFSKANGFARLTRPS
jgi:hypothetical protein